MRPHEADVPRRRVARRVARAYAREARTLSSLSDADRPNPSQPPPRTAARPPRRRRRYARRRGAWSTDQTMVGRIVSDTTFAASVFFRQHGFWAVDTVNANAWPAAHDYLATTAADACLIQELRCGTRLQVIKAERQAAHIKWRLSANRAAITDANRNSAGTGVAVRCHMGLATSVDDVLPEPYRSRFSIRWWGGRTAGVACTSPLCTLGTRRGHPSATWPSSNMWHNGWRCSRARGYSLGISI
jgi:hypothetical protein